MEVVVAIFRDLLLPPSPLSLHDWNASIEEREREREMWGRSASFLLDKRLRDQHPSLSSPSSSSPDSTMDPNPNPNHGVSAYYQTRAEHHAIVSSDWLAQAQAAVDREDDNALMERPHASAAVSLSASKPFSVIDEFNYWRKKPDLAEAVAAIMALAAVIRSCEATTMMELEIELKKASDTLKVRAFLLHSCLFQFMNHFSIPCYAF